MRSGLSHDFNLPRITERNISMTANTETCDTCGKTLLVTKTAATPGGGVQHCPEESDTCGLAERGFNKTIESELED